MVNGTWTEASIFSIVTFAGPRYTKFYNYLTQKEGYKELVQRIWSQRINGNPMFQVSKKLNILKAELRNLRSLEQEERQQLEQRLTARQMQIMSGRPCHSFGIVGSGSGYMAPWNRP